MVEEHLYQLTIVAVAHVALIHRLRLFKSAAVAAAAIHHVFHLFALLSLRMGVHAQQKIYCMTGIKVRVKWST